MPELRFRSIALALVGLTLVAGAIVLATMTFESPRLGRAALRLASDATGLRLEARAFRLHLLRGLRLGEVTAHGEVAAGQLAADVGEVTLAHRLLPLLRGVVLVDEVSVRRPRIEIGDRVGGVEGSAPASSADPDAGAAGPGAAAEQSLAIEAAGLPIDVRITRLSAENGAVLVQSRDGAGQDLALTGIDLELHDIEVEAGPGPVVRRLRAAGELMVSGIETPALEARDGQGRLQIAGGHVRLDDFHLVTPHGRLLVHAVDADLAATPVTYELAAEMPELDLRILVGARPDSGLGPARITMDGRGRGASLAGFAGAGRASLAGGTLPDIPLLRSLEFATRTTIVGEPYEATDAVFAIEDGRLRLDPVHVRTAPGSLRVAGTVARGGRLRLQVTVRAPREQVEIREVPREVLDLLTDDEGLVALPMLVAGTLRQPEVAPDPDAMAQLVRGSMERELGERIQRELNRLLDRLPGRRPPGAGPASGG